MGIMMKIKRYNGSIRESKGDFGSTAQPIINNGIRGFGIKS